MSDTLRKNLGEKVGSVINGRDSVASHLLELLTQPGVVEVVLALHDHNGSATITELQAAGVPHPTDPLRSLAAAGQVHCADGDTWDTTSTHDAQVVLTAAGLGLAGTLVKIHEWGRRNLPPPHGVGRC